MNKVISIDRGFLYRIIPLFQIAILGLALAGCAGHTPIPSPASYDSPEAALRALATTTPGTQAVTATARIEISHNGNRYPLKVAVMMKRPALLRVESIPLLGPPDLYLSVADGELRVFLPGTGVFYQGRSTPQNISRFFPVSMPAADLVSLLMGVPPNGAEEKKILQGDREGGLYRVDRFTSGRRLSSLWIESADGRLIRFRRFTEEGTVVYSADFADHVRFGEGYLPQQVTIRQGEMSTLTVRQADLRQIAVDPEAFSLPVPAGMIPIDLDP
jgi:hypothetical protein